MKIHKRILFIISFLIISFFSLSLVQASYVEYEEVNLTLSVEKLVDKKLDSYYDKISSKSLEKQAEMLRTIIVKVDVIKDKYYGTIHDVLVYIQNEVYKKLVAINLEIIYEETGISYSYNYEIKWTYNYGNYQWSIAVESNYPRRPPFTVELNSDDFSFVILTDEDWNFFFRNIPNHDYILNIKKGYELLGSWKLNFNGKYYDPLTINMKTFSVSDWDDDYNPLEDCELDDSCDDIDGWNRKIEYGDFWGILLVDDKYLEGMPFTVQLKADGQIITTFTDKKGKFNFTNIQNLDWKLQVRFHGVLLVDQQLEFQWNGYGTVYLDADIRYEQLYGPVSNEYESNGEFDRAENITFHSIIKWKIQNEWTTKWDLYQFTIEEEGSLYVKLDRNGSSVYRKLVIYDENGNPLESISNISDSGIYDFYLEYPVEKGEYYIWVSGTESSDEYAVVTYFVGD